MKKYLFACLLLLSSINLFAQTDTPAPVKKNYSIINIIGPKYPVSVSVYLNDNLIGAVGKHENMKYKMYSEGRISVVAICNSTRTNTVLDIKNGGKYYLLTTPYQISVITEDKAQKFLDNVTNVIKIEEDKAHPIAKLNTDATTDDVQKQGTCFLVSKQGYLLTNYHVIKGAKKVQIKGISNDFTTLYGADVVAYDVDLDIALLKLKNQNIAFGDIPYKISTTTNAQGSKSFALGFPMTDAMGEEIKLTEGIISAKSGFKGSISQYQFSAAVQPGNSGSPLFNENGDVIGIVNAKLQGAEGAGYAIKSPYVNTFLSMVDNLQIEKSTASTATLSLADKVAKLKNYTFIVTTE